MKNAYIVSFKHVDGKEDGLLTAIEQNTGLPFPIHRVYTIVNTVDGNIRGFHAHKELWQAIFAIQGEVIINCEDEVGEKETFILNKPWEGLLCGPKVWHTLEYQDNAVLMVLASMPFMEEDYIRDYDEFKKEYCHESSE